MAFVTYYDLKSTNKLPINSKFVDPYDRKEYWPLPSENLDQFLSRITRSHKSDGRPEMFPNELRSMVVLSLAEEIPPKDLPTYFEQKAANTTVGDLLTLAKTTVAQLKHHKQATYLERQERAETCMSNKCRLHSRYTQVNPAATSLIEKVIGLETLNNSEIEEALGTCGMCGCGLKAKNKLDVNAILAGLTPGQLAKLVKSQQDNAFNNCWILREALKSPKAKTLLAGKLRHIEPDQSHLIQVHAQQQNLKE